MPMDYGVKTIGLHRIQARHMTRNPASGRVMQKIGMQYEGCLHDYTLKNGVFENVDLYGYVKE